jgi:hypothetical protein
MRTLLALLLVGCGGFSPLDGGGGADMSSGFTALQDAPDGGALRAVWGSGPDDVHAVGDDGTIFDWDGTQWYRVVVGQGYQLSGVWGSSKSDVWAAGKIALNGRGILFHKTADLWVEFGSTPLALKSVWGVDELRWAVGVQGGIFSGDTSAPFSMGMQALPNPNIPTTVDSPINWSIGGNSRSSVMIAADVDTTFFWDGTMWHDYEDPIDRTRTYRAIFGVPSATTDLWWGANYFGLWHFTGAANAVVQFNEERDRSEDAARFVWSIWSPDGARLVAVGDEGRIMTFDAATMAVTRRPSPTTRSLYGVWGSSFDDLYIVGEGGLLLHGALKF